MLVDALRFKTALAKYKGLKADPDEIDLRMIAGEKSNTKVLIKNALALEINIKEKWVKTYSKAFNGNLILELIVNPLVSGEYKLESLEASTYSSLKIFSEKINIDFSLEVKAYPRVLPLIVYAAALLREAGYAGFGAYPGKRKGHGLEYYETREYVPGDPFRFIDWKATARLSKMMVKEFLEETYSSSHLIYDVRSLGPVMKDENASLFLSTLIGLAESGLPLTLTIKSGLDILFEREELEPTEALKAGLAYVLEEFKISEWDIYELVEPKPQRELMRILKKIKANGLIELLKGMKDYKIAVLDAVKKTPYRIVLTYVGSILYDSKLLVELAEESYVKRHRFEVYTSPKPWLDAENLEEAYLIHESFTRITRAIRRLGVDLKFSRHKRKILHAHLKRETYR